MGTNAQHYVYWHKCSKSEKSCRHCSRAPVGADKFFIGQNVCNTFTVDDGSCCDLTAGACLQHTALQFSAACTWDIQRSTYIIIKGKQSSVLFNLCSYVRLQTTPGRKTRGCGGACDGAEGEKYWSMDESGGRAFGWRRFGRLERKGERCIPVRVGEGRGAGT